MKLYIKLKPVLLSALTVALLVSCTDLEIEETDSLISKDSGATGFTGLTNTESSLNDLYNKVGGDFQTQENMYALSEVSTDELLVPTRGTDWGDNGIWRQLHTHTWTPAHLFVKNSWNNLNQNIFRATEIIESNPSNSVLAEAKFLRAFNMFFVMDLFGSVPFRGVDEGPDVNPKVMSRSEAYSFVETDLLEALPNLESITPGTENTGKASQEAANFLLAKLYLNAAIYNGSGTFDNADMQKVIDAVDAIQAKGFALQEGYFQIFEPTDDTETIWHLNSEVASRIWNTLHYSQNSPDNDGGGWNGFTTLSDFYNSFEGAPNTNYVGDGQEERRGFVPDANNANNQNLGIGYGFLIGQQYDQNGNPLTNRQGDPLVFTKEIPALVGNTEVEGVRVIKYHPYDPTDEEDQINSFRKHQIMFRFADAHLMKAEAMMRMGQDPTATVNELRQKRADTPDLTSVDEQELLDERGRELFLEYWRRNDLIRFGQFTAPWSLKEVSGDETTNLFPIPETALLSNPNLVQNPGY
ncbi:RagB/SusD family nutrient uptake outer membrane protein [Zobellia galactanivorans]|uniref:SusD/RagB family lipoprotein n=1 Tax=Zobellia galactanivorans (strain DSM 12802 / CCUG 47099 / CIP 106680 / NCIMB 13871 / Dsij) TaxID=63186 RepID=G0LAH1_ZOBGA|nr:RagB/SusD family nutrient uptake outer membrane protein [Zobellia galactanivorans]MDO6808493.1 RagB/SusD family nutrient uptake outer membrane protein [Zobellia galactanivorans]CAZ95309.1 SusD/RagB family lipoprotein [Zobellia galactanivorans]